MKILIFGVGQVGKTTVGKRLSEKLNLKFVDLDDMITTEFKTIEHFQEIYYKRSERYRKKTDMVIDYYKSHDDFVMAVSPIYSMAEIYRLNLTLRDYYGFNLIANVNTLYNRTGFYDENMNLLPDSDEYKEAHKKEIKEQIKIDNMTNDNEFIFFTKIKTDNKTVDEVADMIINKIPEYKNKK